MAHARRLFSVAALVWAALTVVVTAGSVGALAQVYRWTDEKGGVHYSDAPPRDAGQQPFASVPLGEMPPPVVVTLSDETFEERIQGASRPFLAFITVDNPECPPCLRADAITAQVSQRFAGRVTVGKLAWESLESILRDHWQIANVYGVRIVPTYILFREGEEVWRVNRLAELDELVGALEARLGER
ncbi:MAG: DUF4124 domain-containing protein [Thermodesulfobacteriota bacterium]